MQIFFLLALLSSSNFLIAQTPPNLPATRNPAWEARAQQATAAAEAQKNNIDLIFDGDSITDFWQTTGTQVWQTRLAKYRPFDFAILGDTTQNLLWRLAHGQAAGLHPKLVVLLIGTNNLPSNATPQEIAQGVKSILQAYQKICPGSVILLQAIFPRGPNADDPLRQKALAVNQMLPSLADGSRVVYADFSPKFPTTDGKLSPEIMPDFLHPSERGYEVWAEALQPYLDRYLPAR